jgi:hypothetical protein
MMCLAPGQLQAIEIYLLCQIASTGTGGGGGGGTSGILRTTGNPEGVLTASSANTIAYDCATGAFYVYCGVAGGNTGWSALIGP